LILSKHLNQLVLFIFVEFRGPTAPETRHKAFETAVIPGFDPATAGCCGYTFTVSGFRNRIASVKILQEAETPTPVLVLGLTKQLIDLIFREVMLDLFPT
jgi:hypothetical protein